MQQILNSEERNQAFLKFLLFFLITVALIVSAVYFNFHVPSKENEWLQGQLEIQRVQEANQEKFVTRMEEALAMFAEMDKKDANVDLLSSRINKTIAEMQELEGNEKTLYGKMNKAIVGKFAELNRTKKEFAQSKGAADQIAKLQNELSICSSSLRETNKALDDYRRNTVQ